MFARAPGENSGLEKSKHHDCHTKVKRSTRLIDYWLDVYSTQIEPMGGSSGGREVTTIDHDQGNLKRSLNGRHIAMIAIASGIGTGLFVSHTFLWRNWISCSHPRSARNRQCTCASRAIRQFDWVCAHGFGCSKELQHCVIHTESDIMPG